MNTTKDILHAALLKITDANRTRFGLQAATLALQLRNEANRNLGDGALGLVHLVFDKI
jgi:hypothetical protein